MSAAQNTYKNILIIKPSALGDIVMALPALSALRRNFPEAKISWLVRPEFAPLLENHPHLDQIIPFDRKFLGQAWFNPKAFSALFELIKKLRQSNFDLVIDLQGLFRTASLAWLSGCKKILGMTAAREFAHIFYSDKVTQDQDCTHVVDYYLKIVQTAGVSDVNAEFVLPQNSAATDSTSQLLNAEKIDSDNYAVLIPGSAHPDKRWPAENFAALADKISSQFGLSIVAVGTKSEKNIAEDLKRFATTTVSNLAGLTNLTELIALLRKAKLVISNDTGPGHIAAALGKPLVLIFGWSNPVRIYPYKRTSCIVAIEPLSRGLALRSDDPKHSVESITVDDVFQKVCEQMQQSSD